MARIGADPEDLRALATELRAAGSQLDGTARTVAALVRRVPWHGPDADRFRAGWAGRQRSLGVAGAGLRDAAAELDGQIEQQQRASEATGAMSGGASGGPTATAGTPGPAGTPAGAAPGAQLPGAQLPRAQMSAATDAGPPPRGEPLPLRAEQWVVGAEAAAVLGGRGRLAVTVEALPGGRSMVWLEDAAGAYLTTGVGAGVGLDDGPGAELGVDGSVGVTGIRRQGWEVADGDVGGLLARLGLMRALDAGPLAPLVPLAPLAGLATAALGLEVPDPAVTDELVSLEVEGGPAAALGLPVAGATGLVVTQLGVRTRGADRGLLLRGTGGWDVGAGWKGPSGSTRTTVEVPVVRGGTQPVILTEEATDRGVATIRRWILEVDRPTATAAARDAAAALGEGDADRAAAAVRDLALDADTTVRWQDAASGTFDDDVHDLDLGAALGGRVEGGVTGGRTVVDYRR